MAKRKTSQAGASEAVPNSSPIPHIAEHRKFCRAYARSGNGTAAYLEVYKDTPYDTARVQACRLLAKDNIQDYIKGLRERDAAKANFTREEAVLLLATMARSKRHKQQRDAINDLWKKLGFDRASDPSGSEALEDEISRDVQPLSDPGAA